MSPSNEHALAEAYNAKQSAYFSSARTDYVNLLPVNRDGSILELGCGNGATGALALQEGKAKIYVGIELIPAMADQAERVLTKVHHGDVERIDLPYAPGTFDALIISEVLEHLVNPEKVLQRLATMLKPGAKVMASSPNIGHWKNIVALFKGRFRYTESGMMDRTHLRWFTPESFRGLFEGAGIVTDRIAPLNGLDRWERVVARTRFSSLVYYQINFHGHYAPAGL